jgi:hypothetical protein
MQCKYLREQSCLLLSRGMKTMGERSRVDPYRTGHNMKFVRKIGVVAAACAVSLGLISLSAPAHADLSWGTSIRK